VHLVPDSSQVTPAPEESFRTVATKVRVCPVGTGKEDGDIDTEMGMGVGVGVPLVISPPPHAVMTTDNNSRQLTAAILRIDVPPGWLGINQRGRGGPTLYAIQQHMQVWLGSYEKRNGKITLAAPWLIFLENRRLQQLLGNGPSGAK
jgi:hypothetical protein